MTRHAPTALLLNVLVAACYVAGAELGLLPGLIRGQVSVLWPPTGIAVTALLVWGPRVVPGVAVGAFIAQLIPGTFPPVAAALAAGNTAAPVLAYVVLRALGFRNELNRLRDALALVVAGALLCMLVSATVGVGVLVLTGAIDAGDFWGSWSVWWASEAMSVLTVTPVLLMLRQASWPPSRPSWRRALEAAALLLGLTAVMLYSVLGLGVTLFLVFPFLIWAAFRFQLRGAAPCALIIWVISSTAATDRAGPFEGLSLQARMFVLQAFNGTTALTALILSALITERNSVQRRLAEAVRELTDTVSGLGPRYPRPPE